MCWWRIHAYEDDEARTPTQDLTKAAVLFCMQEMDGDQVTTITAGEKAKEETRMMIIENQPSRWESTTDMTVVGYGETAKRREKTTTTELGMVVTERQTERRMTYLDSLWSILRHDELRCIPRLSFLGTFLVVRDGMGWWVQARFQISYLQSRHL